MKQILLLFLFLPQLLSAQNSTEEVFLRESFKAIQSNDWQAFARIIPNEESTLKVLDFYDQDSSMRRTHFYAAHYSFHYSIQSWMARSFIHCRTTLLEIDDFQDLVLEDIVFEEYDNADVALNEISGIFILSSKDKAKPPITLHFDGVRKMGNTLFGLNYFLKPIELSPEFIEVEAYSSDIPVDDGNEEGSMAIYAYKGLIGAHSIVISLEEYTSGTGEVSLFTAYFQEGKSEPELFDMVGFMDNDHMLFISPDRSGYFRLQRQSHTLNGVYFNIKNQTEVEVKLSLIQ